MTTKVLDNKKIGILLLDNYHHKFILNTLIGKVIYIQDN